MKQYLALLFLPVLLIGFSSCKKGRKQPGNGTYSGTFIVHYSNESHTGKVTLTLSNGHYECSANPDHFPAGGGGNWNARSSTLHFDDQNMHTADFDWNLILNGDYDFTFDGKHLDLEAEKNGVGKYIYQLTKQ